MKKGNNGRISVPRGYVRLRITKPSNLVEKEYRDRLTELVNDMCRSVEYWIAASFKKIEPHIGVSDISPNQSFGELSRQMEELTKRWNKRFNDNSEEIAKLFTKKVSDHANTSFDKALKAVGFGINFQITPRQKLLLKATVEENVGLIKSIPEQYLSAVSGEVFRAVSTGGDLQSLTDWLYKRHDITRRRAILIASDQNTKAVSNITKIRQNEAGVEYAIWRHSGGAHTPRESHVAFSGKVYEVAKGAKIDGEYIYPGQLIHCGCISIPIISRRQLQRLRDQGKIKE